MSKHIKNIFKSRELEPDLTISKMETVENEGTRKARRQITYYNLVSMNEKIILGKQ